MNENVARKDFENQQKLSDPQEYLAYLQASKFEHVFITSDEKMKQIEEIVNQIADANVSVLVSGESGTGKEVIAQMIHTRSKRKDKPFVAVNCAALPANLLESELFGYEKGAFTGANQQHIGKFEQANNGTLLLDEVTEMDQGLQAKLLRALQEKEIERLGGDKPIPVDTRIIATTNRDVKTIMGQGEFRQDLYYRLYVIHLEVPPLRERTDDIPVLANYYLEKFSKQFHRPPQKFSQAAMMKMANYNWPGNVRELQNIVQRSILMSRSSVIDASDLPELKRGSLQVKENWVESLPIGKPIHELEIHFIIETLKSHKGNRTHASKTLGISLRTLRNKINEFTALGYDVPQPMMGKSA